MKKNLSFAGMATLMVILLASCGIKTGQTSSGNPYELLVVVDHALWERPAGRALNSALKMEISGLPESEPSFRVMYAEPRHYDSMMKLVRNIIVVDIQDIYTKVTLKYAKDVYASPQVILTIQAPDEKTLMEYVEANKKSIPDFFTKVEMNRQIAMLQKEHSDLASAKVDSLFGCDIWLPANVTASRTGQDFFWASWGGLDDRNFFVMYSYPYRDKDTFTTPYFIHKRDSVMKINIRGEKEGMYMATDSLLTDTYAATINNEYTMVARGLWRMKGDFMGGPYVSFSKVDQKNQRVVTAEVFVYSPDKAKGNPLRKMEASLYTLKLPGEGQLTQIPLE
ncbi:MAG: DUF4837 family protein [Mediterranea sp.]|jgi:hypothetical protein|nr:DUF4837 family protein [Mediterranea sp.]